MNFETEAQAEFYDKLIAADVDGVRGALEKGASSNALYEHGETALMIAAGFGDDDAPPMVRLLLGAEANTNTQDESGWTALMHAACMGLDYGAELMRILLKAGANPDKQNNDGETALMIAIRDAAKEHTKAMVSVLLENGADPNIIDKEGDTALMMAAFCACCEEAPFRRSAHMQIVRLLVAHGATCDSDDSDSAKCTGCSQELADYIDGVRNWTPLHRAADARDAKKIHKLLCEGTTHPNEEVESPHPHMRTALEIAKSSSYPTAQPVCKECLALLQPSLVKGVVQSNSGGGGGSLFTTE